MNSSDILGTNKTHYTLSEIESTCKKAARGLGMNWGMAEEAGVCARVLTMFQSNGCAVMSAYFQWYAQKHRHIVFEVKKIGHTWHNMSGEFCPLIGGIFISDRGHELLKEPMVLSDVVMPMLLLPQLYILSKHMNISMRLTVDGVQFLGSPEGVFLADKDVSKLLSYSCKKVVVEIIDQHFEPTYRLKHEGGLVSDQHWNYLQSLAAKTYAPESEESRLSGAGAGLQDND